MSVFRLRSALALIAVALTLVFTVAADAAPRFNAGSRGSRTFSAPPPTATSPSSARPIERSMTSPNSTFTRPGVAPSTTGGLFSGRGLLGGLAAGFLGAGLFGMLFGHGFLGGIAGFAGFLGLLLQVALVIVVARLAWAWWQRRSQPASAYASASHDAAQTNAYTSGASNASSFFNGSGLGSSGGEPIQIKAEDYDAFERTLGDVQSAYSREDTSALRQLVTPEMLSYYAEELAFNASRGVRNEITDVKLLQGDLAEAWREGDDDYATVAMRYQLNDAYVDRSTGRVVEMPENSEHAAEYWTFRRALGGPWMVSAIQQAQ